MLFTAVSLDLCYKHHNMIFSIIICTHNGQDVIANTVKAITSISFDNDLFEVIIVDNNSSDNTVKTCELLLKGSKIKYKIISETKQGLSNARKFGVKESCGEYILFCDDDNVLNKFYLSDLLTTFNSDSEIGCIQGTIIPEFETTPEQWMNRYLHELAMDNSNGDIFGAGICFRSVILKFLYKNGFENICQDRTANSVSSGGDDELIAMTKLIGFKTKLIESTIIHYCKKDRLAIDYLKKLMFGIGHSTYVRHVVYGFDRLFAVHHKIRYIDFYDEILSNCIVDGFNNAKVTINCQMEQSKIKRLIDIWLKQ